jgi:hypothetical protein
VPTPGIDYVSPIRTFRNFFGRYGITGGSIRGLFNAVIPVAVVDRYRDDSEGSLFAMTIGAVTPIGGYAAFAMGSVADDWELLSVNWANQVTGAPARVLNLSVYTPIFPYVPVANPNPAVLVNPGLNYDFATTFGSVTGVGGWNAALPARLGFQPFQSDVTTTVAIAGAFHYRHDAYRFDPPLRIYRDQSLGFIVDWALTYASQFELSALYRIRPRTTAGPRTLP